MTLISVTENNDFPILLADILWTEETNSQALSELPSFPEGTPNIIFEFVPTELAQKNYIISDNLAATFTGESRLVSTFLNILKETFGGKRPSRLEVDNFVHHGRGARYDNRTDIGAILVHFTHPTEEDYRQGNIKITVFGLGEPKDLIREKVGHFRDIIASGSGMKDFINHAKALSSSPLTSINPERLAGARLNVLQSFRANLRLITYSIAHELLSGHSLLNAWGAGFEMAKVSPSEVKFEKLDNYTLIIFKAFIKQNKLVIEPHLMMKHSYHKGCLVIWSTNCRERITPFVVPPIDLDISSIGGFNLPKADFDSPLIAYSVITLISGMPPVVFTSDFDDSIRPRFLTIRKEQSQWIPELSKKEKRRLKIEVGKLLRTFKK